MQQLLQSNFHERAGDLARDFAAAQPFRHIVVDDFLDPHFCQCLMTEFPAFDERKAINELGVAGRKAAVPQISRISAAYKEFDTLMRDRDFLTTMGRIAGIPDLLYDPDYLGGGTHENLDGQDLDLHVDFNYHPKRMQHRRLNLIVFLNPEWQASWGGCLELHKDPWNPEPGGGKAIVPLANRAVLFETTECSWHGFPPITLPEEVRHVSRRSVAVYFYTKERPQQENAHPHGTVYVPRPLPGHLEAGYTLQRADVEALQIMNERRNAQLQFLYERELEFSEAISGITGSISFRLGRALTWPLRKLRR